MTSPEAIWLFTAGVGGTLLGATWQRLVRRRQQERAAALWRGALESLLLSHSSEVPSPTTLNTLSDDEVRDDIMLRVAELIGGAENARRGAERDRADLETSLAALPDGVFVVDAETRLRFLNRAAAAMFGARVENALGAALLEALPSFELEQVVRHTLHQGETVLREMALYHSPQRANGEFSLNGASSDDGRREVLLRVSPVRRPDGATFGAVAIVHDLTELRRLERVRRDFVANASHELRTPVANIRAAAETVLSDPDDAPLRARFLPELVTEAERLSRLVSDLLDLARFEAQNEPTRQQVDLAQIVHEVQERLRFKAQENGVAIRYLHAEAVWVQGEAASLEQVAFNLIDNALAYTPSGGSITLSVKYQSAKVSNGSNGNKGSADADWPQESGGEGKRCEGVLCVADSGIGIPAQDLPRVFERFYRVDKARSRAQGGTGLGLAIVKHIVDNHGGHVTVESEVGKGTTFIVTLPTA